MSKMIQIRNVSDALHKRLRARAALAGMTLSDYIKLELGRTAGKLTMAELRDRLAALSPVEVDEKPVDVIRAMRDGS
jgi:antitoxin FitA